MDLHKSHLSQVLSMAFKNTLIYEKVFVLDVHVLKSSYHFNREEVETYSFLLNIQQQIFWNTGYHA